MAKQGIRTGEFGKWLTEELANNSQELKVYYDHGDSGTESNVKEVQAFINEAEFLTHMNRIACIDIMIARGDEVVCLIEIEESPDSPKGYFGDVMALLTLNRIAIKRSDGNRELFRIVPESTKAIVASHLPDKGVRLDKMIEVIAPRILQFGGLPDGIKPQNTELIFECDIDSALRRLKTRVLEICNSVCMEETA